MGEAFQICRIGLGDELMAMAIALLSNLGGYHHLLQACRACNAKEKGIQREGNIFRSIQRGVWGFTNF